MSCSAPLGITCYRIRGDSFNMKRDTGKALWWIGEFIQAFQDAAMENVADLKQY